MGVPASDVAMLTGAWRVTAAQVKAEDTGEARDLFGPEPTGYFVAEPSGRVAVLITASRRKPPAGEAEAAVLFGGVLAFSGRFTAEGGRLVVSVDAAANPALEGTEQIRFYEFDGDSLVLKTGVQGHPALPDRKVRVVITWRRER